MAVTEFKIKGLRRWEKALKKGPFNAALKKNIKRATTLNAMLAAKEMRRVITAGVPPGNADLTVAIKGSTKTLVDQGDLFQAITYRSTGPMEAFVGVFRTSDVFNVAAIVHEGATVNVTPAMRGLFFMLWKASEAAEGRGKMPTLTGRAADLWSRNQVWRPLKKETRAIVIPGRPFAEKAFRNPALRKQAEKNWAEAVQSTFRERSR